VSAPVERGKSSGFLVKLFVAILLAYALFTSGTVRSYDGTVMLAVTRSMALRGSFEVRDLPGCKVGVDGKHYSRYGIGTSLAALPWFIAGQLAAHLVSDDLVSDDIVSEFAVSWFNPVITALGCVFLYLLAVEVGLSAPVAAGCALIYAFGTGAFVQMKDFNSEPLAGLLLLAAAYYLLSLRKRPSWRQAALAGACVGGLLLVRMACLVVVPVLLLGLIWIALDSGRRERVVCWLVAFAVPIVVAAALMAAYNYVRFGSPTEFGYPGGNFAWKLWWGLGVNLFSARAGLFLYNPVLLIFPVGALLLYSRRRLTTVLLLLLFVSPLVLYSLVAYPAGGHSVGNRYLLVTVPYLLIFVGVVMQKCRGRGCRIAIGALIAISVLVQLPLVYINPSYYYAREVSQHQLREDWAPQQSAAAADKPGQGFSDSLLVQSWQIAVEVTRNALYRGQWLRSLVPRTVPGADAATLVAETRSFHLPYLWWVLAYYYGVAAPVIWVALAAVLGLNCWAVIALVRSWPEGELADSGE